jgi:ubiquitin-like protein Pup
MVTISSFKLSAVLTASSKEAVMAQTTAARGGSRTYTWQQEREEQRQAEAMGRSTKASARTNLKEGIDDLLDEIDSVLEENAEEFVRNYVQKGGQ